MYAAIILLSVTVCGFEFPIVLPTTLEEEAEAVEDNKEKTRQREGGRGTQIQHMAIHTRLPQL